jgi:hypothetical protein
MHNSTQNEKTLPERSRMKTKKKEIMNVITKQQVGRVLPGQHLWPEHVANCIVAEICPGCGKGLYFDGEVVDKDFGTISFSGCPICNWEYYTTPTLAALKVQHCDAATYILRSTSSRVPENTNRHGLV